MTKVAEELPTHLLQRKKVSAPIEKRPDNNWENLSQVAEEAAEKLGYKKLQLEVNYHLENARSAQRITEKLTEILLEEGLKLPFTDDSVEAYQERVVQESQLSPKQIQKLAKQRENIHAVTALVFALLSGGISVLALELFRYFSKLSISSYWSFAIALAVSVTCLSVASFIIHRDNLLLVKLASRGQWRMTRIKEYHKEIPCAVLKLAIAISSCLKKIDTNSYMSEFFVCHFLSPNELLTEKISNKKMDPFLVLRISSQYDSKQLFLTVWDEPNFLGEEIA